MVFKNLDKVFKNAMTGNKTDLTVGDKIATPARCFASALMQAKPNDNDPLSVVENYSTAVELIKNPKTCELSDKQIELIKDSVTQLYTPLLAAPLLIYIDAEKDRIKPKKGAKK